MSCGSITIVLVQNKVDLLDQAAVTKEEAEELATRLKLRLYRVCVKDGFNVSVIFEHLAFTYLEKKKKSGIDTHPQLSNIRQMTYGDLPDESAAQTASINLTTKMPSKRKTRQFFASC
jgi:Ras-related protein Rab-23